MKMMKALYARENKPDCYELTMRPVPKPGPGEILLKVGACGICHTDVIIRAGKALHPVFPFIPGHEFAGEIAAVGPGVTRHKVGDRGGVMQFVTCHECRNCLLNRAVNTCETAKEMGAQRDGAFAEYCAIPAEDFVPIPDTMTFEEAAMVEPLANAVYALERAEIQPNDTVVVIGPGPIGILCAKTAELYDPGKVILVGTREGRLEIARKSFGIRHTVNIRVENAQLQLQDLLGSNGADVVIEAAGTRSALELAMGIHSKGGRIVLEGSPAYDETVPVNRLRLQDNAQLISIATWRRIDYYNAMRYVAEEKIHIAPLLTHSFSLDDWKKGFEMATDKKGECLKAMILP